MAEEDCMSSKDLHDCREEEKDEEEESLGEATFRDLSDFVLHLFELFCVLCIFVGVCDVPVEVSTVLGSKI